MDTENTVSINTITDVNILRSYLRDTTESLHSAAQMGLDLAQQNQALQQRLDNMARSQEELEQRLLLVERDRQWFQQQSLRIDQISANLADLQTRSEKTSRRMASEQHVAVVEKSVERLREDMEGLARSLEESGGTNRQSVGLKTVFNTVRELADTLGDLRQAVEQMSERVEQNDVRTRSMAEDLGKQVVGLRKRVDGLQDMGQEAQLAVDSVALRQGDLEASLKSVIHEYNDMLNEHEQTLRILGEAQSVLESQVAQRQPPVYSLNRVISPSASRNHMPRSTASAASIVRDMDHSDLHDIEEKHTASAPPTQSQSQSQSLAGFGESLGDIFADDAAVGNTHAGTSRRSAAAEGFLPSPPLSTMSSDQAAAPSSLLTAGMLAHTTRKAASVIGTPGDRPKQRTRPRMSSFSKITAARNSQGLGPALSPTKLSDFGNILSATAHVGVGWGNYWQARRDRLQFDIQRRLGLSATATALIGSKVKTNTAEEELGIED
ncbi:hypothetical protein LPJ64_002947 [Coemansia asiatica]|uniref:Uncharacterized protein n=1 Tax=Coemansia asiatica TaxID=1052880 RepID=A0A9W7XMP5_9FUNG|nr:hypothetical protein LPJ64_002947 [Coemansia asiatica]